ncbi:amino acid ABC transporter permease [Methylobacterium indicum]|uniref:ABC transporter permease n=1 Tax=Methylobacterium indicum TaxID=1775910 RepID=A0ABR5GWW1_9HYPH|nr:amino acid ABC transporter permease [Methylobacterium indicum]KMO14483.1 ABC transporter permease [Methylobacterium indicum]KMO15305.1 ABC transporter permease [Methylobacterium indicum]
MHLDFGAVLTPQYAHWILWGAATSAALFLSSWVLAFASAAVLVAIGSAPFRGARWAVAGFVAYHRNIPMLVQIFVWYFAVPQLLPEPLTRWVNSHNSEFIFAMIALFLNAAAYMSEDMRSGLRALPPAQMEAGRALGLSYLQTMRDVLLPQAVRAALPALVNQSLSLFKATSLAMAVGVAEMTYTSRQVENETYRTFETFAIASLFYVTLSFAIMALGAWADRRNLRAAGH